jgi:4-hydroxyphenylacetate 3-monooxygenase
VFRLAWDFVGSALASRNEQYERFYLASGPRNRQLHLAFADPIRADRLVDQFLTLEPEDASKGGQPCPKAA